LWAIHFLICSCLVICTCYFWNLTNGLKICRGLCYILVALG
jgi:hypothetical protein